MIHVFYPKFKPVQKRFNSASSKMDKKIFHCWKFLWPKFFRITYTVSCKIYSDKKPRFFGINFRTSLVSCRLLQFRIYNLCFGPQLRRWKCPISEICISLLSVQCCLTICPFLIIFINSFKI